MRQLSSALLIGAMLLTLGELAVSDETSRVTYLANAGVLIEHQGTKVLFDPLFDNGFGRYELLPESMENDLLSGTAPFDDVDAVFVSHAHGDHFTASAVIEYLRAQPGVRLYAPMQAVDQLIALKPTDEVLARVVGIALDPGDVAAEFALSAIDVNALRIPHSGWPTRMADIENIVFHVQLNGNAAVLHFGDADATPEHFATYDRLWRENGTDLALPPYWFFATEGGRRVLSDHIRPTRAIGMHVPQDMPDEAATRPAEYADADLFTRPGETRPFP